MGSINIDNTGSGGAITLSSDGTSLLLGGTAIGGGGGGIDISTKTANYTIASSDDSKVILFNSTSNTTLTFPAASTLGANFSVTVTNKGTGYVTLVQDGSETLDLVNLKSIQGYWHRLQSGSSITIFTDGSNWFSKSVSGRAGQQIGNNAEASGTYSSAFGLSAKATRQSATAIGHSASATGNQSQALGSAASATSPYAVAVGYQSQASGTYSISLGYARTGGSDSLAGSIANNTSSYGATGANSIAIGKLAKATGQDGVAIGDTTTASGINSVAIGNMAVASATKSTVIGGDGNTASGSKSVAIGGYYAEAREESKIAFGGGYIGVSPATNVYQAGLLCMGAATTDATATALRSSNAAAGTTNQVILPNNSAYAFHGTIVARQQAADGTACAAWKVEGLIRREGSAGTTVLVNSATTVLDNTPSWGMALSADTTNGGLAITVTGAASTDIRWVATIHTSEVTYA